MTPGSTGINPFARAGCNQLERGLYGPIIVDEANRPDVDRDIVVIIDDIALAKDGVVKGDELQLADAARGGRLGNFLLANGAQAPETMPLAGRRACGYALSAHRMPGFAR